MNRLPKDAFPSVQRGLKRASSACREDGRKWATVRRNRSTLPLTYWNKTRLAGRLAGFVIILEP